MCAVEVVMYAVEVVMCAVEVVMCAVEVVMCAVEVVMRKCFFSLFITIFSRCKKSSKGGPVSRSVALYLYDMYPEVKQWSVFMYILPFVVTKVASVQSSRKLH